MKFEVIYEQPVRQQSRFVVDVTNEKELYALLDRLDSYLDHVFSERLSDIRYFFDDQDIKLISFEENYFLEGDKPEYYDHNKVRE